MKWNTRDITKYQKEKKYVDTVLIPLLPMTLQSGLSRAVTASEYTQAISDELERVYQGRLIISLPFTYQSSKPIEQNKILLNEWVEEWRKDGIKHVILLTSDSVWREWDSESTAVMIWLPAVQLHTMNQSDRKQMCSEIVQDLSPIFAKEWS
ncbi:DUF2487 family protein [Alkalicoccobacillus murimartini]|uniref:DUF2487 family protein n=1 Tax=Alkalicoccobacillus murimartini TaxID=171685 RepID=A0ABT9YE80_9BACI|nr:DUF2487 family protein [Alkalicoccobacillus murimartini]MDQ0205933.1 hypothetical protein [Alkalicoccobacillus murimartini]